MMQNGSRLQSLNKGTVIYKMYTETYGYKKIYRIVSGRMGMEYGTHLIFISFLNFKYFIFIF